MVRITGRAGQVYESEALARRHDISEYWRAGHTGNHSISASMKFQTTASGVQRPTARRPVQINHGDTVRSFSLQAENLKEVAGAASETMPVT